MADLGEKNYHPKKYLEPNNGLNTQSLTTGWTENSNSWMTINKLATLSQLTGLRSRMQINVPEGRFLFRRVKK